MIDAGLRFHDRAIVESELTRLHETFLAFYADNVAVASRPFEGIPELLDTLAAAGARLAVCTNKLEGLSRRCCGNWTSSAVSPPSPGATPSTCSSPRPAI